MMCGPECAPDPSCTYWVRPDVMPAPPPLPSDYSVTNPKMSRSLKNFVTLQDALDLIVELWPKPGFSTVQLESHQWVKLRRVLLAIPDLVAENE